MLINQLRESLFRVRGLETKLNQLVDRINSMLDANTNLQEENKVLCGKFDNSEQRSRNYLVVHGVPGSTSENTDDLVMNVLSNELGGRTFA